MKDKKTIKQKYIEEQRKKKIKLIGKWVLVGLGWTSLLLCFVALLVLGIKGCTKKSAATNTNEVHEVTPKVTTPLFSRDTGGGLIDNGYYVWHYGTGYVPSIDYVDSLFEDYGTYTSDYFYLKKLGNNTPYYLSVTYDLSPYGTEPPIQRVRFLTYQVTEDPNDDNLLVDWYEIAYLNTRPEVTANTEKCVFQINFSLDTNSDNPILALWSLLIENNCDYVANPQTFTFNNQINRYGVLGTGNMIFAPSNNYLGTYAIYSGLFSDSEGILYDAISITFIEGNGTGYIGSDGNYYVNELPSYQYIYMEYHINGGNWVVVNRAEYTDYQGNYAYTNKSNWVSQTFRQITIYDVGHVPTPNDNIFGYAGLPLIQKYTSLQVLNMFNNNSDYVDNYTGGGISDVFSLLAKAFESITSILKIEVLPGVSVGLLVFIPLTFSIVLFIVWLIKR